jgi:hypothetical protein
MTFDKEKLLKRNEGMESNGNVKKGKESGADQSLVERHIRTTQLSRVVAE